METKQKTKKCFDGNYRVFTNIKIVFGKIELIHACIKKHRHHSHKNEYIEPKTASEIIKWAKQTYDLVGRNDVLTESLENEFYYFEDLAIASVNRLFPELRNEEYVTWFIPKREDD